MRKSNIWLLPLTIYPQQAPDDIKTISPPHHENDFLIDSGATLNVLNNDTWSEIKEYHRVQLRASTFVLSAADILKKHSSGAVKVALHPDVTEYRNF